MIRCTLLLLIFLAGTALAQSEIEEMSASGLLTEASRKLAAEQYGQAIPYLTEYVERMTEADDARVYALTQKVRLKLGKLMAWLEDPSAAVGWLEQYTQNLPCDQPREAYKLLAANLYSSGQYEQCVSAVTNALARPLPRGLKTSKKTIAYEKMSNKELGGHSYRKIKRIEEAAAEEKEKDDLSKGFSDDVPDPEPDYTVDELVLLNMALAESYSELEQWSLSIEPYRFVIENVVDEDRKGYAIMQLVNALVAQEQFEEARTFIVQLYRTDARYNIRVNMALIKTASALFNVDQYDSALMLYRMVLPREDLVNHQAARMNEIRRAAGLPVVKVTIVVNEAGRLETLFGYTHGDVDIDSGSQDFGQELPPKPKELIELEEMVERLVSLPPYENEVLYQTGLLYAKADRPWEAVRAFDLTASRDPGGTMGQRAFAESLLVLVDPLQKYERVETRGREFLETHIEGLGPRMVTHALTISYQKQELWKEVKQLLPVIEGFVFSDEPAVLQYECELYYMQAIADMVLLNYKEAKPGFERILTDYPDSHQQENASYWHAMAQVFLKNHQEALDELDAYAQTYPDGSWLPSAAFHCGICLFGLEKLEDAQVRFTHVIDTWPGEPIYSDACSLRADLLAAKGLLTDAQRDYEEAIATARIPRQATYAVFQLAAMFDLEGRYDEIIAVVNAYLDTYGETGDVAKAAYWIGKTKLAQGLTGEAVEAYRVTILKYGGNVLQDGVDLIISELVSVSKRVLEDDEREALKESLRASLRKTDNMTLQLRLRVLLASMEGARLELGKQLITELDDLEQAPPPVLAVICDASFKLEDYSRGEEMLTLFETRYEESTFMLSALKLRGFQLFDEELYDESLKVVAKAQALYGTDPEAAWAQILKGRAELKQGRFDAARETFQALITVRSWRGEPYAEATFGLGEVEEAAGDPRKAFGWYQRVYFLYKGYANGYWAAEGYLASARCLQKLGLENDMRNTFRAMLFDKYVNTLPQAEEARTALGPEEVLEISQMIVGGIQTNLTVRLDAEVTE